MSSADTQRAYGISEGVIYFPPDGGEIAFPENAAGTSVSQTYATHAGLLLGPLEVRARETARDTDDDSAPVQLDEFQYREREPGFWDRLIDGTPWEGLLGLGVLASVDREEIEDSPLSRREVIVGAGTLMGLAAVGSRPTAAAEAPTLTIADWTLLENRHGLQLHITDTVADVLPPDTTYYLEVDGHDVRQFTAREQTVVVPPGWTGDVTLSTDDSQGLFDRMDAVLTDDEIRYESLALPEPADTYDEGARVEVTTDPVVVQPLGETERDGSDVIMTIDGHSVPHRLEDDNHPIGYYSVTKDALVYRPGRDPPDGSDVTVVVNPGRVSEFWDDLSR